MSTRPGRRIPKDILTALRSHQVVPGRRREPPKVTEWDYDAAEHGVGRLVDDLGGRYADNLKPCFECDEPTKRRGIQLGHWRPQCTTCGRREAAE